MCNGHEKYVKISRTISVGADCHVAIIALVSVETPIVPELGSIVSYQTMEMNEEEEMLHWGRIG